MGYPKLIDYRFAGSVLPSMKEEEKNDIMPDLLYQNE